MTSTCGRLSHCCPGGGTHYDQHVADFDCCPGGGTPCGQHVADFVTVALGEEALCSNRR